jgi:cytochrome P450
MANLGIDLVYALLTALMSHRNIEWYLETLEKGGGHTVEASLGGERVIFTDDPENIKAVLATQFRDFGKGAGFHYRWREFLGDSIFTTDLDQWHASRQLIRPQFIKDRVSDLETFERHVSKLLPLMGGRGQVVDVESLFFRYTLDATTDFLLGNSVDSLDNPHAKFAGAFGDCQQYQSHVARSGFVDSSSVPFYQC